MLEIMLFCASCSVPGNRNQTSSLGLVVPSDLQEVFTVPIDGPQCHGLSLLAQGTGLLFVCALRCVGKVLWYNVEKEFGYIVPDQLGHRILYVDREQIEAVKDDKEHQVRGDARARARATDCDVVMRRFART